MITDGWGSYPGATKGLYVHEPLKGASGRDASTLLPGVHTVSSLAKRWLLGTHQGAVDEAHLASYLNEFASSASTAAVHAAAAWSSTASSSSPSPTSRCATAN